MTENRALLKQALIEATVKTTDAICTDGGRVKYSDRHRKRLRSLGISTGISTRAKILIAVIAAALLLTGCAIFHEQIAGLFLTFGNGFVNIEGSTPDAPKEIEHAYVATYIPEGFTEVEREEEWYIVECIWKNSSEDFIVLTQSLVDASGFGADTKYSYSMTIETGEFTLFCIIGSDFNIYYWSDNMYVFTLRTSSHLDENEIKNIVNNLK